MVLSETEDYLVQDIFAKNSVNALLAFYGCSQVKFQTYLYWWVLLYEKLALIKVISSNILHKPNLEIVNDVAWIPSNPYQCVPWSVVIRSVFRFFGSWLGDGMKDHQVLNGDTAISAQNFFIFSMKEPSFHPPCRDSLKLYQELLSSPKWRGNSDPLPCLYC